MRTRSATPGINPGGMGSARAGAFLVLVLLASLSLASCHSSSSDDDPDDDPAGLPSPPANLVGSAYGSTDIRLSWEPATDDGWITGYDIERDGMILSTELDALAYQDVTVAPSTTYTYSVVAVDNDGNKSSPATLSITSLDSTPVLNQANYAAIIAAVFDVYRGVALQPGLLLHSAAYYKENEPVSTDYEYLDSGAVFRALHEFQCANGGTASVIVVPFLSSDREVATTYDHCQWGSAVYDGRVTWYWPPQNELQSSYRFDDLSIEDSDIGSVSVDGAIGLDSAIIGSAVHQGDLYLWSNNITAFQWIDTDLNQVSANATDTYFGYGRDRVNNPVARLSGSLLLTSPVSGQSPLTVTVTEDFINPSSSDRYFSVGALEVSAEDGSRVQLEAISTDPTAVSVTLAMQGTSHTFDEPWDTWYPNLTFDQVGDNGL